MYVGRSHNGVSRYDRLCLYLYQAPRAPYGAPRGPYGTQKGPYGPQRAYTGTKPKMFGFGPTIKWHTIFPLKISPEIHWAYAYTYTRPPGLHIGTQSAHMGPQRAHMGTKPKMFGFGPIIKWHSIFPLKISPEINWTYAYTYTRPPVPHMGTQRAHIWSQRAHMAPKGPICGQHIKCLVLVLQ